MKAPVLIALCVISASSTISAEASSQQPRSLFNGRDLSGWHVDVPARDTNSRLRNPFIVRNGMLVSLGEPRGHLITDSSYRDYRLEVEYRFPGTPGNAGVLVHASTPRALYAMFPRSVEVQMESGNAGDFWTIVEDIRVPDMERRRGPPSEWGTTEGKARRILNLTDKSEKPVGQWNTMVIEAVGRTIKVWVNDDLVNSGFDATADHGQIAIQAEGSEVEFRKLLLTPLHDGPSQPPVLQPGARPRARDIGVAPGILPPGPLNAITDVPGVLVGQVTVVEADSVRTGITAILPHSGNLFLQRVPAAIVVGNGFGKLLGISQVNELGELETPILLTCTLCVWKAADAMIEWMLGQPGMDNVRSINAVVGETNDGYELNLAIRSRPITAAQVRQALTSARSGPVEEGSVGAGTGTRAFGWKGGIGTSSRRVPAQVGGYTVGVLVQSNFGGELQIMGAPVGQELRRKVSAAEPRPSADGSIMMVVATDAPLSDRNLERLASRALFGLARTGSTESNGSGDYVIAFSTAQEVRRTRDAQRLTTTEMGNTEQLSSLYEAVIEATEEAIYNSMFKATTVSSKAATVEAIPIDRVREILARYGVRSK
ncbi:MAG TPA: P1 family peptidase [Gemmatimonadaceae bacterium]|nr:P1 family peptidase [Gemmatimonadaceae bacterium]